jgi:hypothetical protein
MRLIGISRLTIINALPIARRRFTGRGDITIRCGILPAKHHSVRFHLVQIVFILIAHA